MPDPAPGPGGGQGPNSYNPKPRFEYKRPSMLAEHKYLAIIFVLVLIAAAAYLFRAPHKTLTIEAPAAPPIYIEAIPQQPVPDKTR